MEASESVSEVLFETIHHLTRPFSSNYPPQQVNEGVKGGLLSRFQVPGVNQLKQKWDDYKYPKKLKKCVSLFVSQRGEHVAVASGNQITILQKKDNYKEPCGIFTSYNRQAVFTLGAWSDSHDIFGAIDETSTLYIIKANGEEIKRITKSELKVSAPIVGLIVPGGPEEKSSCLCSFIMITSNGLLHQIEVGQKPYARILSMLASSNHLSNEQFHRNVLCIDYNPILSLLAVVGAASKISGNCCLSLWIIKANFDVELVFSSPVLDGFNSMPKGFEGPSTTPKVAISPQSKYIAVLDSTGGLDIFCLDETSASLSTIDFEVSGYSESAKLSDGKRKCLNDTADFTWWSDHVLIAAKMSGVVTMVDILTGKKLLEDDPKFCMPLLERVQQCQGCVLVLESTYSRKEYSHASSPRREATDVQDEGMIIQEKLNQLEFSKVNWSLFSFLEKSAEEMYDILIANQQYQDALDFAHRHGLDKDEIFKSQWLHSAQGSDDVNMFLSNVKDQVFILSQCVDKVGPTEEAVKSLLACGLKLTDKYRFSASEDSESSEIWDFRMGRLQLLQYRDKLETFIGINMGRFDFQEYSIFRTVPINKTAVSLAENGKIGALNLLFKRHPYSLAPSMLGILAAIPETVPVQSYAQLLPGRSPPTIISLRENDWVECERMVNFIDKLPNDQSGSKYARTEFIIKKSLGFVWPSVDELTMWYKSRARDIENFSGQLDNCHSMLEFAIQKGIIELQPFNDSISCLYHLIYSDDTDKELNYTMNLAEWEQLSDYEKFKMMLDKVKEDKIVDRLRARAVPFMLKQFPAIASPSAGQMTKRQCQVADKHTESFLVRWLKESASDNKLDICLAVIEEGCRDVHVNGIFRDESEALESALQCVYLCTLTDRWNTMASILSKLPHMKDADTCAEILEKRVTAAKGHVEAGRLLAYYQVPKPMSFFLEAYSDQKSVKQILRLILSKFGRRQPGRSDIDWASMWRDMQLLQEKAFPFLDLDYMLIEFCRGLLKAGKFPLARNYLKGTATVVLTTEKTENLVIQAAREYFFSASSLACTEIWKAKECLNLFPNSQNVKAEADTIDVLTVKLPNLGVTLLPMQFRQIRDPMEIINMVIASQIGAYLNVDELLDIARVLGLRSQDEIAAVREAVAREAAVSGDLQLAFDQCLVLAKMGHGSIWDLCAAIARGPVLDNVDISSRKQLLSFSLSHCDEESIGELLHAWKDLDMQGQCENLMMSTGTAPPNLSVQGSSIIALPGHSVQDIIRVTDSSNTVDAASKDDFELHFKNIKNVLSAVARTSSAENQNKWESLLRDNGKVLTFAALQLPWLLELSKTAEYGKPAAAVSNVGEREPYISVKTQAVLTILSWLARNDIAPSDDLIASLARSIMEVPVTEEEDILGCSFLLNLVDAFHGVRIIEEQLKAREGYLEVSNIMNIGMIYSSLHNSGTDCGTPTKRKELLLRKFQEKHTTYSSDEMEKMDNAQFTFWREWKSKLEEQKQFTDQSRALKLIIPSVDTARFLSGDADYIENVVFSLIDSVKQEKKPTLKDVLVLADTYGLNHTEVLLRYLTSVLVSELWENEDIAAEISGHEEELLGCAAEVISTISSDIYPAIDGCNKQRLAYIYGILSKCYLQSREVEKTSSVLLSNLKYSPSLELPQFYKVLEQECSRVSFIKNLNFKNIAGLEGLNIECFNDEVCKHINEFSVEALAGMVKTLASLSADPVSNGLISWQAVYKHYILNSLTKLVPVTKESIHSVDPELFKSFINELEENYDCIKVYISSMSQQDVLEILKKYCTSSIPHNGSSQTLVDETKWFDCLVLVLKFWTRLIDDVHEVISCEGPIKFNLESLSNCLTKMINLLEEEKISTKQGWDTIFGYANHGMNDFTAEASSIYKAMILSGCRFDAINQVCGDKLEDLSLLYVQILDSILLEVEDKAVQNLLSSLCKSEGDLENLKQVRSAVWGRLSTFADNMQLKSHIRVYTLELLQSITVGLWENWDEPVSTIPGTESADQSRFTSTLVALKSTRLASNLSPNIDITPEDLVNIETAVSCFTNLSETATTENHFKVLQDILQEWEGLFLVEVKEEFNQTLDSENNWGDDWDEGWESFHEETPVKKEDRQVSIHPLHICWMQIITKLIASSRFRDVMQLMDRFLAKPDLVLLDEDDTKSLVITTDCEFALKLALLLPYEAVHLQCLDTFEAKLKQGIFNGGEDQELFILFLSSGVMSTVASNVAYGTTFSYICYMAGQFSRLCLERQLKDEDKFFILFREALFPCFVAELVKAKQPLLAGFMVCRFMQLHSSLNLVNVAEASVRKYLEGQIQMHKASESVGKMDSCIYLENTVSTLRGKLNNVALFALSLL